MDFQTVILGSGYFSLGYASTHENTLIIEDTQLFDPHFCGTLSGFNMKTKRPASKGAVALYDAFVADEAVGDAGLAVNELEPALCRFALGNMPNVLLGSFCTDVKKTAEGYEVTFCNNNGISRVLARRVIDTRIAYGNKMNLLIAVKDGAEPRLSCVKPAFYADQRVIELEFDGAPDVNEAKSQVLDMLEEKLAEVGARIVGMSYRMCGAPVSEPFVDGIGVLHVDERGFDDIFAAYEQGEEWK